MPKKVKTKTKKNVIRFIWLFLLSCRAYDIVLNVLRGAPLPPRGPTEKPSGDKPQTVQQMSVLPSSENKFIHGSLLLFRSIRAAIISADDAPQRENLLQGAFQLLRSHEPFELRANNPLAVHGKDPRLSE